MKSLSRRLMAGVLAVMLLATVFSPLAGFCLSIVFEEAETCAGDCDTCGCSPERRALHTCCCQTRLKQCEQSKERQMPRCCQKHDNKRIPAVYRACACGKGKQFALWEKEEFPVPECIISDSSVLFREGKYAHDAPDRLVSRNVEPPVPPPESSFRL